MTEIDFDELDKAVGQAMGTPSVQVPVAVTPTTSTPPPVISTPQPTLSVNVPPRRTSGRFMDVVHPSSDMRPRAANLVAPHSSALHASEPMTSPQLAPALPASPVLSFSAPAPAPTPIPTLTPAPAIAEPISAEPTPTPFINDAKIEKRPLGAFSVPEAAAPASDSASQAPAEVETPMPPELQNDILHIESDSSLIPTPDTVPVDAASPVTTPATPDAPVAPTAQNSIFGAAATPLGHPAKKKSGWLWVIWIVGLLVVGGGIGAGVYFYVLPLL